jgi:hypothetical protein
MYYIPSSKVIAFGDNLGFICVIGDNASPIVAFLLIGDGIVGVSCIGSAGCGGSTIAEAVEIGIGD